MFGWLSGRKTGSPRIDEECQRIVEIVLPQLTIFVKEHPSFADKPEVSVCSAFIAGYSLGCLDALLRTKGKSVDQVGSDIAVHALNNAFSKKLGASTIKDSQSFAFGFGAIVGGQEHTNFLFNSVYKTEEFEVLKKSLTLFMSGRLHLEFIAGNLRKLAYEHGAHKIDDAVFYGVQQELGEAQSLYDDVDNQTKNRDSEYGIDLIIDHLRECNDDGKITLAAGILFLRHALIEIAGIDLVDEEKIRAGLGQSGTENALSEVAETLFQLYERWSGHIEHEELGELATTIVLSCMFWSDVIVAYKTKDKHRVESIQTLLSKLPSGVEMTGTIVTKANQLGKLVLNRGIKTINSKDGLWPF